MSEPSNHDYRRFLGGAAIILVAALRGILRHDKAHSAAVSGLPVQGELPHLNSAGGWLNSQLLKAHGLLRRVVLINFWTYTCINWPTSASLRPRVASPAGASRTDFMFANFILVMGSGMRGNPVRFRVLIDGQPSAAAHGIDLDNQGNGTVAEPGIYQLIGQAPPSSIDNSRSNFLI